MALTYHQLSERVSLLYIQYSLNVAMAATASSKQAHRQGKSQCDKEGDILSHFIRTKLFRKDNTYAYARKGQRYRTPAKPRAHHPDGGTPSI